MLDPQLRELARRIQRIDSVEVRPCGHDSPQRAMDVNPTGCSWDRVRGLVDGVAAGLGVQLQHGVTERHFTVHEPCTHPGHYELE